MQDRGWIKIDRKLLQWEHFREPELLMVFMWLLLNANITESKFQGVTVPRGGVVTSRRKMAKDLGLTERKIRTHISTLESTHEVTHLKTHNFSLFIVVSYDKYQSKRPTERPTKRPTNRPQSKNIAKAIVKNNKEGESDAALTAPTAQEEEVNYW